MLEKSQDKFPGDISSERLLKMAVDKQRSLIQTSSIHEGIEESSDPDVSLNAETIDAPANSPRSSGRCVTNYYSWGLFCHRDVMIVVQCND